MSSRIYHSESRVCYTRSPCLFFFFFFQAEDGIRDGHVTGVQTCALPICGGYIGTGQSPNNVDFLNDSDLLASPLTLDSQRSEERRVGEECGSRGGAGH